MLYETIATIKNLPVVINGDEKPVIGPYGICNGFLSMNQDSDLPGWIAVIGKKLYFVFNSGNAFGYHQQEIMMLFFPLTFDKTTLVVFKIDVFAKAIDLLGFIFLNELFNKD